MIAPNTQAPEMGTVTGRQSVGFITPYDGELQRDTTKVGTFKELKALRKDPTIALGSGLLVSGILAGAWSIETDEEKLEEVTDFITKVMLPLRESIIRPAVAFGRISYGWMPYEEVFAIKDGRIVIERMKPLLHEITTILVDDNGNFRGFRQKSPSDPIGIDVPFEKCTLINFDVEGGDLYGYALLENIRAIQTAWSECDKGAKKYDAKIAGAHWVIHYPTGVTTRNEERGAEDNYDIAMEMLHALEASGSIVVPSTVSDDVQELNLAHISKLYQWNVELISDQSPRQASFIEREKHLEALMMRGLGIPERACTEGHYGTKSEAETHVDLLITNMESIDRAIVQVVNTQVVDQLLMLNWGLAPGTVRLVAAPLIDEQISFLRKLYLTLGGKQVDIGALQETLNIPPGKEKEQEPNVNANAETED